MSKKVKIKKLLSKIIVITIGVVLVISSFLPFLSVGF